MWLILSGEPDSRPKAEKMVSPEGIDHGKARLKAEAVWLILSGEPDSRPKAEKMVSRAGIEPFTFTGCDSVPAARPKAQPLTS